MKKSYLTHTHNVIKITVCFVFIYYWLTRFLSPSLISFKVFDFPMWKLFHYDNYIDFLLAIFATVNVLYARKRGDVRWLVVTPLIMLTFQILLMILFDAPSIFDIPTWGSQ